MMDDSKKTKAELIEELNMLRLHLAELHTCEEERRELQGSLQKALHELHIDNTLELSRDHIPYTLKLILDEFTKGIQASREQFRTIIDRSADGVIIVDDQGIVRFFNPAAETLFNRSAKEMIGNLFGFPIVREGTTEIEIITDHKELRFAEMRVVNIQLDGKKSYLASIRDITHLKRIQQSLKNARDQLELRVQERTRELSDVVEQLEKEISERKRSQEEMRLIKEKYENLIKNIPDALYSVLPDENGTTIFMSPRWNDWTGFMPEDFYSDPKKLLKSIHQDDRDKVIKFYKQTRQNAQEFLYEFRVIHKNTGQEFFLRDHGVPIKDQNGTVIRFDGIVTNITEQKKLQEQLIKAEKLATVGQLASSVSHELRNPLNVIGNSIYYLKSKVMGLDEKMIKHIKILQKEVNRAYRIISNILNFSKTQKDSFIQSDINILVRDSLSTLDIPENITVKEEFSNSLPHISVDPDHMRHVFDNLITNAFQAMTEGGILEIKTVEKEGYIEIEFKDEGQGISQKDLENIFDPLFTTRPKGIGLGLAIVKDIVCRYDGDIKVRSKINQGSTFIVKLPLQREVKEIIVEQENEEQ